MLLTLLMLLLTKFKAVFLGLLLAMQPVSASASTEVESQIEVACVASPSSVRLKAGSFHSLPAARPMATQVFPCTIVLTVAPFPAPLQQALFLWHRALII